MPYIFRTQPVRVALNDQASIATPLRNVQLVFRREANFLAKPSENIIDERFGLDDAGVANFKLEAKKTYGLR